MENIMEKITMEMFVKACPSYVELVEVDWRDNLNNHLNVLFRAFANSDLTPIYDLVDDMRFFDDEWDSLQYYIKDMCKDIARAHDLDIEDVLEFARDDNNSEEIRDIIYEKDSSDVLRGLISNTDPVPIMLEMYSSFDQICSHWWESQNGYTYEDHYLGDMCTVLNLNPAKLKEAMLNHDFNVCTDSEWPDLSERDGQELVCYEAFIQELQNNCMGGLLTFMLKIDPSDILNMQQGRSDYAEVKLYKGTPISIFDSWQGSGSLFEMSLLRDTTFKFKPEELGNGGLRIVDGFMLTETYGFSGDDFAYGFDLI